MGGYGMKREYEELLLRDLCIRLPYDTMVYAQNSIDWYESEINIHVLSDFMNGDYIIKPYLFPLKTMTIEQRNEFYEMTQPLIIASFEEEKFIREEGEYRPITPVMMYPNMAEIDWLFKRHFDVFGLIEKGLAIDATSLNIYNKIDYETRR